MRLFPLYPMFLVSLVSGAPSDLGQSGANLDDGLQFTETIGVAPEGKVDTPSDLGLFGTILDDGLQFTETNGVAPEDKVDAYEKMVDYENKLVGTLTKAMKDVVDRQVKFIDAPSDLGQFGTILDGGLQFIEAIGVAPEGKVDAYKKMVDYGNKLVGTLTKAMKDVTDKQVKFIEEKVEEIEDEIDNMQSKELESRKKILSSVKEARKEFQIIRRNLEGLASETVRRVDELVLVINSDAVSDEKKFKFEVKRMISLMKRSREVIATSENRYHEINESLNKAHDELKALKNDLEDLGIEDLASLTDEREERNFLCGTTTAAAAVGHLIWLNVVLPWVGTAIAIPLAAAQAGGCWGWTEGAVDSYENAVRRSYANSLRILENLEPVIKEVKKFENDIKVELNLLSKWETELEFMKDHFESTEDFEFALSTTGKEHMIEMLNELKKVCEEYLLGNTLTQSIIDKWVSQFNAELEADFYEYLAIETSDDENEIQNGFEELDADGNKLISRDELQKVATTSGQNVEGLVTDVTEQILSAVVEKTIKKMDIDGDAQINFEEYQKMKKSGV